MQDQSTKGNDDRTAFMAGEVNSEKPQTSNDLPAGFSYW